MLIRRIPGKGSGAWVFRDSGMDVPRVLENLKDGMSIDEITDQASATPPVIARAI